MAGSARRDGQRVVRQQLERGDDREVAGDDERVGIGRAGQVAAPAGEAPARRRRRADQDPRAEVVESARGRQLHAAGAARLHGRRHRVLGDGRERGCHGPVAVDGDRLRRHGTGQVAAEPGERPTGRVEGRDGDDGAAVVDAAGRRQRQGPAPHDRREHRVDRHRREGGAHRGRAVHRQDRGIRIARDCARPAAEGPAQLVHGRQCHDLAARVVGQVGDTLEKAAADRRRVESVARLVVGRAVDAEPVDFDGVGRRVGAAVAGVQADRHRLQVVDERGSGHEPGGAVVRPR